MPVNTAHANAAIATWGLRQRSVANIANAKAEELWPLGYDICTGCVTISRNTSGSGRGRPTSTWPSSVSPSVSK
jgi:hypothetical protein